MRMLRSEIIKLFDKFLAKKGFKVEAISTTIKLRTLSKSELLFTKLIGLGDRIGRDEDDILAMKPTREEMIEAFQWAKNYDGSPRWDTHLLGRLQPRLEKLGYGL